MGSTRDVLRIPFGSCCPGRGAKQAASGGKVLDGAVRRGSLAGFWGGFWCFWSLSLVVQELGEGETACAILDSFQNGHLKMLGLATAMNKQKSFFWVYLPSPSASVCGTLGGEKCC